MEHQVSKSRFKARALQYFREVEETKESLVITDRGRPVLRLIPYQEDRPEDLLGELRGSVLACDAPTAPVALGDWEALE